MGCERLPELYDTNLDTRPDPATDYIPIDSISDILGMPLVGYFSYPTLHPDSTTRISSIVKFEQEDECFRVDLSFHIKSLLGGNLSTIPFISLEDCGRGIYDPEADALTIWADGIADPIMELTNHPLYRCLQVTYNFTPWYNTLFTEFILPLEDRELCILVPQYETVKGFLFYTKQPYPDPSRVPILYLNSEAVQFKPREASFYEIHQLKLKVDPHVNGNGYSCMAIATLNFLGQGSTYKEVDIPLSYVEADTIRQEFRAYISSLDTEDPYFRIAFYPEAPSLILYWTPGTHFQKLYRNRYLETSLSTIPLCDEQLEIRLSQDL